MTKTIGIAMLVIGSAWWVTGCGVADQPTRPAAQSSSAPAKELTLDLGNKVTMKLVLVPAGKFMMGSPEKAAKDAAEKAGLEGLDLSDEGPQHEVTISKPFYMGVYHVTQEQYAAVIGKNPSYFKAAQNPVETVSWDDAVQFCKKLSTKTGKTVQLPTEAQWEYGARAGTTTPFNTGDTISTDQANYNGNEVYGDGKEGENRPKTTPVGSFKPNAWGLYDMHGNVYQWCADWYGSYSDKKETDPEGPANGQQRVLRGGSWFHDPWYCRCAFRFRYEPVSRSCFVGFRVAVLPGLD